MERWHKKNLSLNNKEQNPSQILILFETFVSDVVIQSFLFGLLNNNFLKISTWKGFNMKCKLNAFMFYYIKYSLLFLFLKF